MAGDRRDFDSAEPAGDRGLWRGWYEDLAWHKADIAWLLTVDDPRKPAMEKTLAALIFDMDGTLIDSATVVPDTYIASVKELEIGTTPGSRSSTPTRSALRGRC